MFKTQNKFISNKLVNEKSKLKKVIGNNEIIWNCSNGVNNIYDYFTL